LENNTVVGFKPITSFVMMENVAGYSISLNEDLPSILISFKEADELNEGAK
jgi:hypothetical protein